MDVLNALGEEQFAGFLVIVISSIIILCSSLYLIIGRTHKIKEFLTDIKIYFKRHFEKPVKHVLDNYYSFDHVYTLPEYIFLSFEDFYLNGGMEIIDWEWEEHHKEAKKQFDKLFFLIKFYRKWTDKLEKYYSKVFEETGFDINWEKCEDNVCSKLNFVFNSGEDEKKYDKFSKWYFIKENELEELKEEVCVEIIKLRNNMWT